MTPDKALQKFPGNPAWGTRFKRYTFAENLDPALRAVFRMAEQQLLYSAVVKNSRSTSAGIFGVDGKKYFIKRSNVNSFWERVRRIGRRSRAELNMLTARKLESLEIRTPEVYMALSTGSFFLPGASYLITECFPEPMSAAEHLPGIFQQPSGPGKFIDLAAQMIRRMHCNGVKHGDLKMSNLLMLKTDDGTAVPGVFDLDGSKLYGTAVPDRVCIKELARAASSFCFYALRSGLMEPEKVEFFKQRWCQAYAQAGGRDYANCPGFQKRFNDFLPLEKIEKLVEK